MSEDSSTARNGRDIVHKCDGRAYLRAHSSETNGDIDEFSDGEIDLKMPSRPAVDVVGKMLGLYREKYKEVAANRTLNGFAHFLQKMPIWSLVLNSVKNFRLINKAYFLVGL